MNRKVFLCLAVLSTVIFTDGCISNDLEGYYAVRSKECIDSGGKYKSKDDVCLCEFANGTDTQCQGVCDFDYNICRHCVEGNRYCEKGQLAICKNGHSILTKCESGKCDENGYDCHVEPEMLDIKHEDRCDGINHIQKWEGNTYISYECFGKCMQEDGLAKCVCDGDHQQCQDGIVTKCNEGTKVEIPCAIGLKCDESKTVCTQPEDGVCDGDICRIKEGSTEVCSHTSWTPAELSQCNCDSDTSRCLICEDGWQRCKQGGLQQCFGGQWITKEQVCDCKEKGNHKAFCEDAKCTKEDDCAEGFTCKLNRCEPDASECGVHEKGSNGICVCDSTTNYYGTPGNCALCEGEHKVVKDNNCVCDDGYEDDGSGGCKDAGASECGEHEKESNGACVCDHDVNYYGEAGSCALCEGEHKVVKDNSCVCDDGYEDDGSGGCKEASASECGEHEKDNGACVCDNDANYYGEAGSCALCEGEHKVVKDNSCVCDDGYEDDGNGGCKEKTSALTCGVHEKESNGACVCDSTTNYYGTPGNCALCEGEHKVVKDNNCVCEDGYENDGNGGCKSDETSEICDNNVDDDSDGKIDCKDEDCTKDPKCIYCQSYFCAKQTFDNRILKCKINGSEEKEVTNELMSPEDQEMIGCVPRSSGGYYCYNNFLNKQSVSKCCENNNYYCFERKGYYCNDGKLILHKECDGYCQQKQKRIDRYNDGEPIGDYTECINSYCQNGSYRCNGSIDPSEVEICTNNTWNSDDADGNSLILSYHIEENGNIIIKNECNNYPEGNNCDSFPKITIYDKNRLNAIMNMDSAYSGSIGFNQDYEYTITDNKFSCAVVKVLYNSDDLMSQQTDIRISINGKFLNFEKANGDKTCDSTSCVTLK